MTIVFRISSFVFVIVLATKSTLMVMDNQHSNTHKSTATLIHLLDEGTKHREELREANDNVVFAAQAMTIMAIRVIDSCISVYRAVKDRINTALYSAPQHLENSSIRACATGRKRPNMWHTGFLLQDGASFFA